MLHVFESLVKFVAKTPNILFYLVHSVCNGDKLS